MQPQLAISIYIVNVYKDFLIYFHQETSDHVILVTFGTLLYSNTVHGYFKSISPLEV